MLNAFAQPGGSASKSSLVGMAMHELRGGAAVMTQPPMYFWYMEQAPDGRWVHVDIGAYQALPAGPRFVIVKLDRSTIVSGVWSRVYATQRNRLSVFDLGLTNPMAVTAKDQADILKTIGPPEFTDASIHKHLAGDASTTRILWLGVLNDLFVLLLFLALGCSLVLNVKRIRRERAQRANRCPTCGYSLDHLNSSVCPECGKPLIE